MDAIATVEIQFDNLMHSSQTMAELAQTKIDNIHCGEVQPSNMMLGTMLCKVGTELKEVGEHLLKCSNEIKEGCM